MKISSFAGKPATPEMLVNVPKLITAYYSNISDITIKDQQVMFGTSGHRGSSFNTSFNEWQILAITQVICLYRVQNKICGPLFLGRDAHAFSELAIASALEVLVATGVEMMFSLNDEYVRTPVISHAILNYNRRGKDWFADGIIIRISHNQPHDGGFKYTPPKGAPAEDKVPIASRLSRMRFLKINCTMLKDFHLRKHFTLLRLTSMISSILIIDDLALVTDMDALGDAGVHYWRPIAERYSLILDVVNEVVDPTFSFMTVDWDGQIRMDSSSPYAMQRLIELKDSFILLCPPAKAGFGHVPACAGYCQGPRTTGSLY